MSPTATPMGMGNTTMDSMSLMNSNQQPLSRGNSHVSNPSVYSPNSTMMVGSNPASPLTLPSGGGYVQPMQMTSANGTGSNANDSENTQNKLSKLVKLADQSPTQKKISNNIRGQVTRKQIESFFDLNDKRVPFEDKAVLKKNMSNNGKWIPLGVLMQLKNMIFPGHDIMRECIIESAILEMNESDD
jgi:hypothetical protein